MMITDLLIPYLDKVQERDENVKCTSTELFALDSKAKNVQFETLNTELKENQLNKKILSL